MNISFVFKPVHLLISAVLARHVLQLIITADLKRGGEKSDLAGTAGLALCYTLVLYFAVVGTSNLKTPNLAFVMGFWLMETSVFLRMVALLQLGKQFSYEIRILDEHQLVTDGIYGVIRHPLHLAFLGEVIGIAVISSNFSSFLVVFLLFLLILHRNRIEDEKLGQKFGEEFEKYRRKVPSLNFFRGIIRRSGKKRRL